MKIPFRKFKGSYSLAILICVLLYLCPSKILLANSKEYNNINKEAEGFVEQGNYRRAIPLYERALALCEKGAGPQHPATISTLVNLAYLYELIENYPQAITIQKRILAAREKTLGLEHPETATSINNLASFYQKIGEYAKALPLFERSLRINTIKLGPKHPETATSNNNLANLYRDMGEYAKARPLFERALEIRKKNLGIYHSHTAQSFYNLALNFLDMGDRDKALPMFETALKIKEKVVGKNHPEIVDTLGGLAAIYNLNSDYPKAISYTERALEINEKTLGAFHSMTAFYLRNIAILNGKAGDYTKAISLCKRALEINERVLGPEHPTTASTLTTLASQYQNIGDYINAEPLIKRALAINEKKLGPLHPSTAATIHNLGLNSMHAGEFAKAVPFFEHSVEIIRKSLGSQHTTTAEYLANLGNAYFEQGNYAKAAQINEQALTILEQTFGPDSPPLINTYHSLAGCYYMIGEIHNARNYAIKLVNAKQRQLPTILTLDENSRLFWQNSNLDFWIACVLTPDLLQQVIFNQKGVVLDSLAEDRAMALAAGSSGEGASILEKIKSLQSRLSKITFEQGIKSEATKLQDEIGRLQRELTSKYLGRDRQRSSASLTMLDIMPALKDGGALVDFIEFKDHKLDGHEALCIGAIITDEDNNNVFVRIDGGTAINRAIDKLRTAINQGNSIEVEAQTKFLSEKLWSPIAAKIPEGTKRLFLCPDANLNFLSFAALLESDGRFVAEKYPITYIGSARDLAKKPSGEISKSIALIANPQFDATAQNAKTTDLLAMRSAEADVFGSIALPPLPGTEAEASSLQALASEKGWQTKSYLGSDATETSVRNTKKPGVLHLATHGFYLNSFTPPGPEGSRGMSVVGVKETAEDKKKKDKGVDPMRASGVAFTGAQQTLTSWSQKKAPNPETDGVLTAEEVGALRLDGTWLVTLSACETGVGEARSGEGVFGLRRAFMIAGAENLLMTLWPVADETTAKIMTDFYKEAFATGDAPGSLAKVQRDWLVKLRQERGLLAAVREAGPFAMVTMTNPNAQRDFVEGQLEIENASLATRTNAQYSISSSLPVNSELPISNSTGSNLNPPIINPAI